MPFQLSPAEEMVRKIAREFTERTIIPYRKELQKDNLDIWHEQIKLQGKAGFHLHIIPREEGGTGLGYIPGCLAVEELCAGWPDLMFVMYYECAYIFVKATGGELYKKYMPRILKGEVMAVPAVTEPTGGSDLLGLQTTAKKVSGGWVLNGRKCFVEEGEYADFAMVLCKTGDPADPKTPGLRSLSAFIVEKDMPGFRPGRLEDTLVRKADLAELILDNVFVPDTHLVGEVGRGVPPVFAAVSDSGRRTIAAMLIGIILGSYQCSVKYARERKLYGRPIADLQAIQFRIAEMTIDLEAARSLLYRAAWLRTQGQRADTEMAIAKYYATHAALRSSLQAVNIHGAYGVMDDYLPQRYYRCAPLRITAGGTDEALKMMIANAALNRDANPDLSRKPMDEAGWSW